LCRLLTNRLRLVALASSEVLLPIIEHWKIFELTGLDAAAEAARKRLEEHLETLDAAAKRFEERMLRSTTPPIAHVG